MNFGSIEFMLLAALVSGGTWFVSRSQSSNPKIAACSLLPISSEVVAYIDSKMKDVGSGGCADLPKLVERTIDLEAKAAGMEFMQFNILSIRNRMVQNAGSRPNVLMALEQGMYRAEMTRFRTEITPWCVPGASQPQGHAPSEAEVSPKPATEGAPIEPSTKSL